MSDICTNLEQQADRAAEDFAARFRPLAETEIQRAILADMRTNYRARCLSVWRSFCAARESSVGPMMAGRSGYSRGIARRHERAVNRQDKIWLDWIKEQEQLARDTHAALIRAETQTQRAARLERELWAAVRDDVDMVATIDRGEAAGWNRSSFVNNCAARLRRAANSGVQGEREAAQACLRKIAQQQQSMPKPMFTPRNKIWAYLDGDV